MILFIILSLILIFLLAITIFVISAGGTVFILIFSDVIVCIAIIMYLIKRLFKKNNRENESK